MHVTHGLRAPLFQKPSLWWVLVVLVALTAAACLQRQRREAPSTSIRLINVLALPMSKPPREPPAPKSMCGGAVVAVIRPDRSGEPTCVGACDAHKTEVRSKGTVRASIAAAVSGLVAAPPNSTVTFVVTNLAYVPLTLNFFRIAARLEPPLASAFSVAVDAEARELLAAASPPAFATVFEAAAPGYDGNPSTFGSRAYNLITEHKWRVAAAVLAVGHNALMADPDVALLRNPVSLLDSGPQCDFTTMIEISDSDASPASLRAGGGFAGDGFPDWMNTGFVLFRASPRMREFMATFLEYLTLPATRLVNRDDQWHFNTFLHSQLRPRGLRFNATLAERGQLLIDAMSGRQCIDLVTSSASEALSATRVSWLPLSPLLFMNRLALDKFALHERNLEKPYAVHHNFLVGLDEKVCSLRAHGQWYEA